MGTVAIVGVGLIGGSIGMALRARGLAERVVGVGRNPSRLDAAARLGAIDDGTTDEAAGVAGANVVVVCTPVTEIAATVRRIAHAGPAEFLITDAGSTKRAIVEEVARDPRARLVFVGGHPIAGSERQGVEFADAGLFQDRSCVITPTRDTPEESRERARRFWESLGCRVLELDPAAHDDALALTSHLPHAVASALAAAIPPEHLALAAGAYRDGTRVAAADAGLWAGIFLENRGPLLAALTDFEERLGRLRRCLEAGDEAALKDCWETGKGRRLRYSPMPSRIQSKE